MLKYTKYRPHRLESLLPGQEVPQWQGQVFDQIHSWSMGGASTIVFIHHDGMIQRDPVLASGGKMLLGIPIELLHPERDALLKKELKDFFVSPLRDDEAGVERCVQALRANVMRKRTSDMGDKDYVYRPTGDELTRQKRVFVEMNRYPHVSEKTLTNFCQPMVTLVGCKGERERKISDEMRSGTPAMYSEDANAMMFSGDAVDYNPQKPWKGIREFKQMVAEEVLHGVDCRISQDHKISRLSGSLDLSALEDVRRAGVRSKDMLVKYNAYIEKLHDGDYPVDVQKMADDLALDDVQRATLLKASVLAEKVAPDYRKHFAVARGRSSAEDVFHNRNMLDLRQVLQDLASYLVAMKEIVVDPGYERRGADDKQRELFAKAGLAVELLDFDNGCHGKEASCGVLNSAFGSEAGGPKFLHKIRDELAQMRHGYEARYSQKERDAAAGVAEDIALQVERRQPGVTGFRLRDPGKWIHVT